MLPVWRKCHRNIVTWDFTHVEGPYIVGLWILLASIAKIGFHLYNKLSSIFPESCMLILLGVLVGLILYFTSAAEKGACTLHARTFFIFLLPPIVLEAGYFLPNRAFFDNIGTIVLYAVVGTFWNIFTIGLSLFGLGYVGATASMSLLECLVFSTIVSAVDPVAVLAVFEDMHVNEVLHILVFGESLLNDAVIVAIYHILHTFVEMEMINGIPVTTKDIAYGSISFFIVALGGLFIGVLFGLGTAFITRYTDHVRVIEPLFVFIMAYLSYLSAEVFHLSGIMAIVFAGITMKQYVEANISQKSHTTIKYFMKMLSSVAETIIFMFLGLSTVVITHKWDTVFIIATIVFCLFFRALGVLLLTGLANRVRLVPVSWVDQFVMSYGGLRGAIAFCLVMLLDDCMAQKNLMVTTTITVVYFTVFVQGISIKPLVNKLHVQKSEKHKPSMNEQINDRMFERIVTGMEDITGHHGYHWLREKFEILNVRYLQPLLMREAPKTRDTQIFEIWEACISRSISTW